MTDWLQCLDQQLSRGLQLVMVTVIAVRGSAPREVGARMLVTRQDSVLTIGGGNLEYQAIDIARQLLEQKMDRLEQHFSLGATLGQCCGGSVTLLFERIHGEPGWLQAARQGLSAGHDSMLIVPLNSAHRGERLIYTPSAGDNSDKHTQLEAGARHQLMLLSKQMLQCHQGSSVHTLRDRKGREQRFLLDPVRAPDFAVYVFGAGHVGRALVQMLSQQNCQIHWIETRDGQLPPAPNERVSCVCTDTPEAEIAEARANSYFVIMTHDHALDLRLTAEVLKRDDFAYLGLIGSRSKRKRFEHRLLDRGFKPYQLARIKCPIGIVGIRGKEPARVALAVTAQLIQTHEIMQIRFQQDQKIYNSA